MYDQCSVRDVVPEPFRPPGISGQAISVETEHGPVFTSWVRVDKPLADLRTT